MNVTQRSSKESRKSVNYALSENQDNICVDTSLVDKNILKSNDLTVESWINNNQNIAKSSRSDSYVHDDILYYKSMVEDKDAKIESLLTVKEFLVQKLKECETALMATSSERDFLDDNCKKMKLNIQKVIEEKDEQIRNLENLLEEKNKMISDLKKKKQKSSVTFSEKNEKQSNENNNDTKVLDGTVSTPDNEQKDHLNSVEIEITSPEMASVTLETTSNT